MEELGVPNDVADVLVELVVVHQLACFLGLPPNTSVKLCHVVDRGVKVFIVLFGVKIVWTTGVISELDGVTKSVDEPMDVFHCEVELEVLENVPGPSFFHVQRISLVLQKASNVTVEVSLVTSLFKSFEAFITWKGDDEHDHGDLEHQLSSFSEGHDVLVIEFPDGRLVQRLLRVSFVYE